MEKRLTQERLKELLDYNEETGEFHWKVNRGAAKAGMVAGVVTNDGYRQIQIDNKPYKEHRLAWLYVHGYLPEEVVHHINHIRDDNRIANLMETSQRCNTTRQCSNTSGIPGVSWNKSSKKWKSYITVSGKRSHLGYFTTIEEAAEAREAAYNKQYNQGCNI